jgi:hypothetical protein
MPKSKYIPPKTRKAEDLDLKFKKTASKGDTSPSTLKNGTQDPKKPSEPKLQLPIKFARHKTIDPDKHLARSSELVREDSPTSRSKFSDNNSAIKYKSVSAVTNKKGIRASPLPNLCKTPRSSLTPVSSYLSLSKTPRYLRTPVFPQSKPAMMSQESLVISPLFRISAKI